jgi:putative Holliday junction resolvase
MIDQAAAVEILQGWLDERSRAVKPGESSGDTPVSESDR